MQLKLSILVLLLLPIFSLAQPETTIIDGKTFFVYPFQVQRPYCYPDLAKGVHYRENWQDGTRQIEALTPDEEISAKQRKQLAFIRKEAPWLYYQDWHLEIETPAPALDTLPDGDYVQYYQGLPYIDGDTIKFRFGQTAALFSLRNNLPNGRFVFFSSVGDTVQMGNYSHGKPDGEWELVDYLDPASDEPVDSKAFARYILEFNNNGRRNVHTDIRRTYVNGVPEGVWEVWTYDAAHPENVLELTRTTYQNGSMTGPFEEYKHGFLLTKGTYLNREPVGEWFHYLLIDPYGKSPRTQLAQHYSIPAEPKTGRGPIIRDRFYESDNDTVSYGRATLKDFSPEKYPITERQQVLFSDFYAIPQPDSSEAVFPHNRIVPDVWVQMNSIYLGKSRQLITRQQAIDSMGYQLRYSFYEEFYPNGQLLLRFNSHEGQLEKEDTIFWNNGQAANVVNYLPETDQYEEKLFNREGQLVKSDLFDSKGAFIRTTVNRTGIHPEFIRLEGIDFKYNQRGQYVYQLPYNQPVFSGVTVLRASVRDTDSSLIEHEMFDPATYVLTKRFTNGPFTILTTGTVDSTGMIFSGTSVCTMGDFSRTLPLELDQSAYQLARNVPDRILSMSFYTYSDSVPLLYRGQPYTGKIELHYDCDSTYYRFAKGTLHVFVEESTNGLNGIFIGELIHFPNYAADYYSTYNHSQGPISGNFVNGFADGAWKISFSNDKLQCKFALVNRSIEGKIKSYSIAYPKVENDPHYYPMPGDTFPKRATYYLRNETTYENGKMLSYKNWDWTGSVVNWADITTGASYGRQGNVVTHVVKNSDSTVVTIFEVSAGKERLVKRTATKNPPEYIPETEGEGEGETKLVPMSIAETWESPGSTEQFYYETGSLFQLKQTDSLGNIIVFETYLPNGDQMEKTDWKNGSPMAYESRENGSVKRRFEFHPEDSVTLQQLHWLRPSTGKEGLRFPFDPSYNNSRDVKAINCRQVNYDQNGIKRSEGELKELVKSETWTYYNEEGKRVAEIDYTVPLLIPDSSDLHQISGEAAAKDSSVFVFEPDGKRLLYDTAGNRIAEQWIIELYRNYSCVQDEYYETRNYYTIWESDSTLHLRNGWTKHRDENGSLQCEGQSINGLPEGFWKFYNPDGTIKEAGLYHKGKRNGRWLSGDLSKVNYLGDLCIDPNEANSLKTLLSLQKELDITVTYYDIGKKLSTEYFNVNTGR